MQGRAGLSVKRPATKMRSVRGVLINYSAGRVSLRGSKALENFMLAA